MLTEPGGQVTYALDPESLSIIAGEARRLRPRLVVEYGSGVSTLMLAEHSERVISLEHDRHWHAETLTALGHRLQLVANSVTTAANSDRVSAISDRVSAISDNVDLRWCRLRGGTYRTALPDGVDLALIDGPRIREGRGGTLPQLWPRLTLGALVFVDDLHHRPVQRWVADWQRALGCELERLTERLGVIER